MSWYVVFKDRYGAIQRCVVNALNESDAMAKAHEWAKGRGVTISQFVKVERG